MTGSGAAQANGRVGVDTSVEGRALDKLLHAFVKQHRMKLPGGAAYVPCYRVVS